MKLEQVKIKNFRGYKNETIIDFDNLTALVGKNDVGKSTILEALDLFFNDGKGVIKGGVDDVNVTSLNEGDKEIIISACFGDVPDTVVIDATNSTSLQQEYLLNEAGQLEIVKKYVAGASSLLWDGEYMLMQKNIVELFYGSKRKMKGDYICGK